MRGRLRSALLFWLYKMQNSLSFNLNYGAFVEVGGIGKRKWKVKWKSRKWEFC